MEFEITQMLVIKQELFYRVDHPFIFILNEKSRETRNCLFLGKIITP